METAVAEYKKAGVKAECAPFFTDVETHLAHAHYVVARAGASSVSEIMVMGLPALFVPLAIAMDNHQQINAMPLKNLDAADIMPELAFTPQGVKTILAERLNDSNWLTHASNTARNCAKPDATNTLADLVAQTC
jgi:UDP-N-acetylglucosamine--N-acetylmuramyl-(pentapeptide) pyrophosphoryl-undecaprenol N-acetylglucosamine transferase